MNVGVVAAGDPPPDEFVEFVERRIGLGDHELVFDVGRQIFHLFGSSRRTARPVLRALFSLAIACSHLSRDAVAFFGDHLASLQVSQGLPAACGPPGAHRPA